MIRVIRLQNQYSLIMMNSSFVHILINHPNNNHGQAYQWLYYEDDTSNNNWSRLTAKCSTNYSYLSAHQYSWQQSSTQNKTEIT